MRVYRASMLVMCLSVALAGTAIAGNKTQLKGHENFNHDTPGDETTYTGELLPNGRYEKILPIGDLDVRIRNHMELRLPNRFVVSENGHGGDGSQGLYLLADPGEGFIEPDREDPERETLFHVSAARFQVHANQNGYARWKSFSVKLKARLASDVNGDSSGIWEPSFAFRASVYTGFLAHYARIEAAPDHFGGNWYIRYGSTPQGGPFSRIDTGVPATAWIGVEFGKRSDASEYIRALDPTDDSVIAEVDVPDFRSETYTHFRVHLFTSDLTGFPNGEAPTGSPRPLLIDDLKFDVFEGIPE